MEWKWGGGCGIREELVVRWEMYKILYNQGWQFV